MPQRLRTLARRASNRFAAPYVAELAHRIAELGGRIDAVERSIDGGFEGVRAGREEERLALKATEQRLTEEIGVVRSVLRHTYEQDAEQRRRLHTLRETAEYELAFTEEEPLVSFIVPTHTRFESLRDVSLPSILGQTYSNIEVIVAGDCSPPETGQMIAELGDPRVRFHNRSVRGPYPEDKALRWYMIGTPPFNDGLSLVRGRWIAILGDDDAVRPTHVETLLRAAQGHGYEHCYGRFLVRYQNGEDFTLGSFPPERGQFGLQAALYHSGLRYFEMEPADYLYKEPNDWSLCRRMLSAGVRFGMVDDVVVDKYETRYESPEEWGVQGIPVIE
jgi:hypothetical protein